MNPRVWEASGHVSSFSDPLIDCKECKCRIRVDNLINDYTHSSIGDALTQEEMMQYIVEKQIPCPKCGETNFTDVRQFNLMFETKRGVTEGNKNIVYLRPENAQGEYVNFLNVLRTSSRKLPFSIGQIGKAFRNEITPGNFTFRTIEFEQMEFQTFCHPDDGKEIYDYYKQYGKKFFEDLGIAPEHLQYHDHEKLAHYAKEACDIEYLFPFGWGEINGTHNRSDFDLTKHQDYSGKKMEYFDQVKNEKYIPYIIESTYGLDRLFLALICENYKQETLEDGEVREVLAIKKELAPVKINILPLIKKEHSSKALEIYKELRKYFMCMYDDSGSIGKRYRRGDAIGVPYAICVDNHTLESGMVTVRDRDTMLQKEMSIDDVIENVSSETSFQKCRRRT